MQWIAEVFLILSIVLLGAGLYLRTGLDGAMLGLGCYFGIIAFSMANKRSDGG